jgi:beta-1,2-mannobiose phosphorylase / 1,2-beta-oligomannan phosphorylase
MTFTTPLAIPYALTRIGVLMTPDPAEPFEAEGVLNPATAWAPDGSLRLYPRLVADGNFSRIGQARVVVENGVPVGVERESVALEPSRSWERGTGHGGTEDARITRIDALDLWVMTYVAFGPTGPRPALAVSKDLEQWTRLGPVLFDYDDALDTDLNLFPNKDVVFFPEVVAAPDGTPSFAALHRPMWELSFMRPDEISKAPAVAPDDRPSIWISYVPVEQVRADIRHLVRFGSHRFVAGPEFDWEVLKIGAGPAPLRVPEGWLLIHHGVAGEIDGSGSFAPQQNVFYSAGAMILDGDDPSQVRSRSSLPLLTPETADETAGIVSNVVFPTAIERIEGHDYVFYGMADSRIGVARLERIEGVGA